MQPKPWKIKGQTRRNPSKNIQIKSISNSPTWQCCELFTCNWRMQSSSCLCKSSWAPKASENGGGRKQLKVEGETETPNWLQQSRFIVFWLWGAWRRWKWSWRGWGLGKLEKMSSRPETGLSCIDQSCWRPVDMVVMVVGKPKFSEQYNCGAWTAIFSRPVGEMNKSRRPKGPP